MNLASLLLLFFILFALIYAIRTIIHSEGACDDCHVACPVNENRN